MALGAALLAAAGCAPAGSRRPSLPAAAAAAEADAERRAAALVATLTLDEKVSQLVNAAAAIPRFGTPRYDWWSESLHGVARNGVATVFPQAIALAATFDEELVRRVAAAIAVEARAKFEVARGRERGSVRYGGLTFFAPNLNLFRDPRWGRGQETYGEDPFLTGRLGVAYVRGLQGDDPRRLTAAAVAKHFAVHSGPESLRHSFDARVDARDLADSYLPQFEAVVREARVAGVMAAYNRVNGEPCVASGALLGETLRRRWAFAGFVVGDCGAVGDVARGHGVAADETHAAALALRAGTDLDCGRSYQRLTEAVRAGLVTEGEVDRAAIRLLAVRIRLGLLDAPAAPEAAAVAVAVATPPPEHRALAREAASKAMVLLTNDGTLPIAPSVRRLAVIGPTADDGEVLVGNYHGTPVRPVTLLAGLRTAARARGVEVRAARGTSLAGRSRAEIPDAVAAARWADLVVLVLGLSPRLEGEENERDSDNPAGDRRELGLPGAQPALFAAVLDAGRPTVVVLTGGSALALPDGGSRRPGAVLMAWYPGEAGGEALADVLFGEVSPSGRLPITFYRSAADLPPFADYRMAGRTYRYFAGTPLHAFAHGLGYAPIRYGPVEVRVAAGAPPGARADAAGVAGEATAPDGGAATGDVGAAGGDAGAASSDPAAVVQAAVVVGNDGDRAADEVVAVFAAAPPAGDPAGIPPGERMPRRGLVAFRRISLAGHEAKTVAFAIPLAAFAGVDARGERRRRPGPWQLTIGRAAPRTIAIPPP